MINNVKARLAQLITLVAWYLTEFSMRWHMRESLRGPAVSGIDPKVSEAVNLLRAQGLVRLDHLKELISSPEYQLAFANVIDSIEQTGPGESLNAPAPWQSLKYTEFGFDSKLQTISANNPFEWDSIFLEISLDPTILKIVDAYFGQSGVLQQSIVSRYLPNASVDGQGSWQWHHDGWGPKLNAMFLFSDVGSEDQYMSYALGSHRRLRSHRSNLQSRSSAKQAIEEANLGFFDCTGEKGTVFLFDSNGLHSGRRSIKSSRDSLITSFNVGRYLWPLKVKADDFGKLGWR
jgi:hypothetical protein